MRVLIVAYYYPPKGGAGTQRFAKFVKYLPRHGVEPVVLTTETDTRSEHAPDDDASLDCGDVRVERVGPPAHPSLHRRWSRRLRLHIDEDEWADAAAARALDLAREQPFDVVVTTLSPYACYRVGEILKRRRRLPWVVDLRDPWALDAWRVYPSVVHAGVDLRNMRRAMRGADFVIANVPEARRAFVAEGVEAGRCVVIPNGFDEDDFAVGEDPRTSKLPFRLVHVGTFHPATLAPGFTRNTLRRVRNRQIAPLGRTGFYLLAALARYREHHGLVAGEQLQVDLYGRVDDSHRRRIAELGLEHMVNVHGYVPHAHSVAALQGADAVFVPLHDVPRGERALVVPGKLYEALASERPVLAALPPGDGADLIRRLDAGIVVSPTDVDGLAAALTRLVARHMDGDPIAGCARARLVEFSRQHLTARLHRVLEAAASRAPAIELASPWPQDCA